MESADASHGTAYLEIRPYLFSVAYRMTGSASDAEDLVQDAWIRYLDAGSPTVDSLRAYLTTIVSRLALDYLKSARVQRERYVGMWLPEPVLTDTALPGPADMLEQRETVSLAFLTLLEALTPEQRVVYVLRVGLGLSFSEIAAHLRKSPAACRQIFHRACKQVPPDRPATLSPAKEHRHVLDRFAAALAAGRAADLARLLADDVVWVGDGGAERLTVRRPVAGADKVSRGLAGFTRKAPANPPPSFTVSDVNGAPALIIHDRGGIERVIALDIRRGRVTSVRVMRSPSKLRHLERALQARERHPATIR